MATPGEHIRSEIVVVGSGPNGLSAALHLARAGLEVTVVESQPTAGGGCRTESVDDDPAFTDLVVDPCAAVHPLAAVSPAFADVDLPLARPPIQLGHALPGRDAVVVTGPSDELADSLASWRSVVAPLTERLPGVLDTLLSDQRGLPAPGALAGLASAALRLHPVRLGGRSGGLTRLSDDSAALAAGIAAHGITPLHGPAATGVALMLGVLLHADSGWPVPIGGSGSVTGALLTELSRLGVRVITNREVTDLRTIGARHVVLNTSAREAGRLLHATGRSAPARRLLRARLGGGAAKVDLAVHGEIPWRDPRLAGAGTVHLGGGAGEIALAEREVRAGRHAERPFVLLSQPAAADPGRIADDGRRPVWAYAHVPRGSGRDVTGEVVREIERAAPGFRDVLVGTRCTPASRIAERNVNFTGGDIAAGAVDLRGLLARPVARRDPYGTGVDGVWLASGSTPPGPGVHGMAGLHVAERILRASG